MKDWVGCRSTRPEEDLYSPIFMIQSRKLIDHLEQIADNQEIDDLVDEWQPTPLVDDPTEFDEGTLDSVPMIQGPNGLKVKIQPNGKSLTNLATPNWTGLIENDAMKQVAVDTLKEYGVGTCGPSGFYGSIGEFLFSHLFVLVLLWARVRVQHHRTTLHVHSTLHHLLSKDWPQSIF